MKNMFVSLQANKFATFAIFGSQNSTYTQQDFTHYFYNSNVIN